MKITEQKIKLSDLYVDFVDNEDTGAYAYSGKLCIRPNYQRNFCYKQPQQIAVIETVLKGFPLGVFYWSKSDTDKYEVIDGQQRIISICNYIHGGFSVKIDGADRFYHNMPEKYKQRLLDYELTVFVCEGTEDEKLEWFKVINIAGERLTAQELLNATYVGTFLQDAKQYFSKRNCVAAKFSEDYVKGNPIRQELLEIALGWIAERDNVSIEQYLAIHQHDKDASNLWQFFQTVVNWAKTLFPNIYKKITDAQNWGKLYIKYHENAYNANDLHELIKTLIMDDEVTNKKGIIEYVLSQRTFKDERVLSLRQFTDSQKLKAYERQGHKCPICQSCGCDTEYKFEEMHGDHIKPWSHGGRTTDENCQMLCAKCNQYKSNR